MIKTVYLLEVGVLLDKSDEEYEHYSTAYDEQYGYYDQNQEYKLDFEEAKKEAEEYVLAGVPNTYAVIMETFLCDYCFTEEGEIDEDVVVEDEEYIVENVRFSMMKDAEEHIIENFIKGAKINE